jgi:hypothetical protein
VKFKGRLRRERSPGVRRAEVLVPWMGGSMTSTWNNAVILPVLDQWPEEGARMRCGSLH